MSTERQNRGTGLPISEVPERVRKFSSTSHGFRWDDVPLKTYKEEGSHFKSITRQTLFSGGGDQPCDLRYFEIAPGGHSTFERHMHTHAVLILRGCGRVLIGDSIRSIEAFDLVHVPPLTWHQFRATEEQALGFLCQVACDRDRPMRPDTDERHQIRANPVLADFARF